MAKNHPYSCRTDMALESHNFWKGSAGQKEELPGLSCRSYTLHGLEVTQIQILDDEAAQALGKARGRYFSLSLPKLFDRGSIDFPNAAKAVAELVSSLCGKQPKSVLVAALGNPDITPDALGSLAAGSILVTRHLDRNNFPQFASLALCRPGGAGYQRHRERPAGKAA
jgi:spore protease